MTAGREKDRVDIRTRHTYDIGTFSSHDTSAGIAYLRGEINTLIDDLSALSLSLKSSKVTTCARTSLQ
jgi:hypothetical protein